jgi:hypothetical protein
MALRLEVGRPQSSDALTHLDGSIIAEVEPGSEPRMTYQLSTLGLFLTDEGPELALLLARYLGYVRDRVGREGEVREIAFADVRAALDLDDEQMVRLRCLLFPPSERTVFLWATGGSDGKTGYVNMPSRIEELFDVEDLERWIEGQVLSTRCLEEPIDARSRRFRPLSPVPRTDRLSFVKDKSLHDLIAADLKELETAHEQRMWKCAVVLSGSIAEGLLLGVIEQQHGDAIAALKCRKPGLEANVRTWDLAQLVAAAEEMNQIRKSSTSLSSAVRHFRNLVHPGRQLAEGDVPSKEMADIANNTVDRLIRELAAATSKNAGDRQT